MPVDTTLKYRGHNSYQMAANEVLYSDPYDVSLYQNIVFQLAVIRLSGSTTATLRIRYFDADNKTIKPLPADWSISVTNKWAEIWQTRVVPENAVTMQWEIRAGSSSFHIAIPKAGPGTFPTAFSSDTASRESLLTADGLYTGTVLASQILVVPVEGSLNRLDEVLTSIQAGHISLSELTSGKIAGLDVFTDRLQIISEAAFFRIMAQVGEDFIQAGSDQTTLFFRVNSAGKLLASGADIAGKIKSNDIELSPGGDIIIGLGATTIAGNNRYGLAWSSPSGTHAYVAAYKNPNAHGIAVSGNAGFLQIDYVAGDKEVYLLCQGASGTFGLTVIATSLSEWAQLRARDRVTIEVGAHALGVDGTGPYRIKSGTKTYF